MEDSVIQLIIAASGLISAVSGIVVYALSRIHLSGKAGEFEDKVQAVAQKLEQTQSIVTQHEVQLKTGVAVVKELAPEAKKFLDEHAGKIADLEAEITAKTAALNELKKTLPQNPA